jgi:hypothetical protein
MKKKLWTFGDSFTAPFPPSGWGKEYIDWKGYTPKVHGEIIAEKLGYTLVNLGRCRSDNYRILETICENLVSIKSGDIVIIGWSSPIRFRLVSEDKNEVWNSILPGFKENKMSYELIFKNTISENTLNEILYNRKSKKYIDEVVNWGKLIDKALLDNIVIHWSPFAEFGNCIKSINNCNKIHQETNGELLDHHFSEIGQMELANELIKIIELKQNAPKNKLI